MFPTCLSSFQLEFEDFALEFSPGCIYDAVTVYSDAEEENQLGEHEYSVSN